jgi:hypothetical protein
MTIGSGSQKPEQQSGFAPLELQLWPGFPQQTLFVHWREQHCPSATHPPRFGMQTQPPE